MLCCALFLFGVCCRGSFQHRFWALEDPLGALCNILPRSIVEWCLFVFVHTCARATTLLFSNSGVCPDCRSHVVSFFDPCKLWLWLRPTQPSIGRFLRTLHACRSLSTTAFVQCGTVASLVHWHSRHWHHMFLYLRAHPAHSWVRSLPTNHVVGFARWHVCFHSYSLVHSIFLRFAACTCLSTFSIKAGSPLPAG